MVDPVVMQKYIKRLSKTFNPMFAYKRGIKWKQFEAAINKCLKPFSEHIMINVKIKEDTELEEDCFFLDGDYGARILGLNIKVEGYSPFEVVLPNIDSTIYTNGIDCVLPRKNFDLVLFCLISHILHELVHFEQHKNADFGDISANYDIRGITFNETSKRKLAAYLQEKDEMEAYSFNLFYEENSDMFADDITPTTRIYESVFGPKSAVFQKLRRKARRWKKRK